MRYLTLLLALSLLGGGAHAEDTRWSIDGGAGFSQGVLGAGLGVRRGRVAGFIGLGLGASAGMQYFLSPQWGEEGWGPFLSVQGFISPVMRSSRGPALSAAASGTVGFRFKAGDHFFADAAIGFAAVNRGWSCLFEAEPEHNPCSGKPTVGGFPDARLAFGWEF